MCATPCSSLFNDVLFYHFLFSYLIVFIVFRALTHFKAF